MGSDLCHGNEACTIVTTHAIPALGCILSLMIYLAPFKAVRRIEIEGSLGNLNPMPFSFLVGNGLGWIFYGFLTHDYYVVAPNIPGAALGLYYLLVGYKAAPSEVGKKMSWIAIALLLFQSLVGIGAFIAFAGQETGRYVMGVGCSIVLVFMYISPLTTFARVLRERNAIYFYMPLCVACLLNSALWTTYGAAIQDFFQIIPNGLGLIFSILQIVCIIALPSREIKSVDMV